MINHKKKSKTRRSNNANAVLVAVKKLPKKNLKETFILWKRKENNTYSKSYVQDVIETNEGKTILELSDGTWYTSYPTRIETQTIDILTLKV